ncbi:unnamed protein product [Lactuca virosa]|uniref:Uncharacterized protein n=1 Tax=Lactuca virosa TaxID=75947 RepID=A0AAU9NBH3_9ASTR|nr:unnamed protein product [Lactuca virosa]
MDAQLRCQIAFRNVRHLQAVIDPLIRPCPVWLLVAGFGWSATNFYYINTHLILRDCSQNKDFNLQDDAGPQLIKPTGTYARPKRNI